LLVTLLLILFYFVFSAEHGGLPDSLLKDAFHIVLESYYSQAQNNTWQRQQLDKLTRMWKVCFRQIF
jgi:hypothetical protein